MASPSSDRGSEAREPVGRLTSPVRNRYFDGKRLSASDFELEQRYGISKRWLLNRLTLGEGVVAGLEVTATPDGAHVVVAPGVAIDALGREIVVPERSSPVDPRHRAATVTLSVRYSECETEPSPLPSQSGSEHASAHITERYRLCVDPGAPETAASGTPDPSIPLAVLKIDDSGLVTSIRSSRRLCSNRVLLDIIVGLSVRVAELERAR